MARLVQQAVVQAAAIHLAPLIIPDSAGDPDDPDSPSTYLRTRLNNLNLSPEERKQTAQIVLDQLATMSGADNQVKLHYDVGNPQGASSIMDERFGEAGAGR